MALLTLSRGDKRLVDLPTSWSNAGREEQLQRAAAESFSNLVALAVAKSGANFQLYDAHRSLEEQIEMLKRNYRRVSRARYKSSDRTWDGSTWEKRTGRPNTASPGWSNHGSGLAVDIHPGPIQEIFKSDGPDWGWSWAEGKENGESWHFVYVGGNRYASRGWLDHAWVQKVVGADVDGKIGTGTVEKIRAWQKAHGLEADGIVGPGTKKAMLGKDDASPVAPAAPGGGAPKPSEEGVLELVPLPVVERDTTSPNKHPGRVDPRNGQAYGVKHITVHWWGEPKGQAFDGIVNHLCTPAAEVSAHYVISPGRVTQLVDEADSSWANGNRVANFESITIECDPNDVLGTLPVLAALIRDIRSRHGDLPIYPHQRWTATECPGDYLPHLGAVDQLARTGEAVVSTPAPATPSTGGKLPEGKELLVKLTEVPDFPLLRTPGNLCYYGDASGPIESVSGKNTNSLNPGEIYTEGGKTRSRGIVTLQKQLVKRGYAVDVDGRWGAQMDNAIDNLQRLAGVKRDKKCGPVTWYAAFLLPIQ